MELLPYPVDHIGIACHDLEKSIDTYRAVAGLTVSLREELPEHGVTAAFLESANTSIELLAPIGEGGVLYRFLQKRGPGLHHLCFRVPDVAKELHRLAGLGYTLIDAAPRQGARNSWVAFLHPKSSDGTMIELSSPC